MAVMPAKAFAHEYNKFTELTWITYFSLSITEIGTLRRRATPGTLISQ